MDKTKTRRDRLLGALLFLLYLSLMTSRRSISAAMPAMLASGGFTKSALGTVATAYFLCYALMQLPCGLLGDRFSAPVMMSIGVLGAGVACFLVPFAKTAALLNVLWGLCGFFQAFVWSSLMRVVSLCIGDDNRTGTIMLISVSGAVGMLLSYALGAVFSGPGTWKYIFIVPGSYCLIMGILWVLSHGRFTSGYDVGARPDPGTPVLPAGKIKAAYAACGLAFILIGALLHGIMKDGLSTFIPTYLAEVFSMSEQTALLISMLMAAINFISLFVSKKVSKKGRTNEMRVISRVFFFCACATALMVFVFKASLIGTVVCFSLLTFTMQMINLFLISLLPFRFRRESLVATTTGLVDAFIYLGSAAAGTLFGTFSERFGWDGPRMLWVIFSVLGTVICALAAKHFEKRVQETNG